MTPSEFLAAYREEMAPTLGGAYMDGFIARNRARLLQIIAPLIEMLNEPDPEPPASRMEVEDPDAVTPEKDAIVWAAFMGLVNEKRRALGMEALEVTESMSFFGRRKPGRSPIAITLRHPRRHDLIAMVTASASEPGRFQLTWADDEGPSGHTTRDTAEEAVRYAVDEGYRLDTANTAEAREMVEEVQRAREARAAKIESWLHESDVVESSPRARVPGPEIMIRASGEVVHDRGAYWPRNGMGDPLRDPFGDAIHAPSQREAVQQLLRKRGFDYGAVESLPLPKNAGRKGDKAEAFRPNQHVIRLGDMIKMEGQLGGYVEGIDQARGTAKIEQDNGVLTTWPLVSLLHDTKKNRDRQQAYNDKIDAETNARLELSLANWKRL